MGKVDDQMLYEMLESIHAGILRIDEGLNGLRCDNLVIREQIHAMQGDMISMRGSMMNIDKSLDRIETRLDLREAQTRFEPRP